MGMFMFMFMCMLYFMQRFRFQVMLFFQFGQQRFAVKHIPRCRHYCCMGIVGAEQIHCLLYFFTAHIAGAAQENCISMLHLIQEELTEIFQVHFAFVYIYYYRFAANLQICFHTFYGSHHIRQLAYTRRLDNHALRSISMQHFLQSSFKITG